VRAMKACGEVGCSEEEITLLPAPGIETRLLGRPAFILTTIVTELSKLCAKPHL